MDYQNAQIAETYDLVNPWAKDSDFYLSLAGRRPCSVVDLGCGTGTLCCALAERGHWVTGVDPGMAADKAAGLERWKSFCRQLPDSDG
jgi:2-polyprenyl-3-methyl-5-hydroxy-6-metoxy-1,4-benzoquinol methylase